MVNEILTGRIHVNHSCSQDVLEPSLCDLALIPGVDDLTVLVELVVARKLVFVCQCVLNANLLLLEFGLL